MPVPLKRTGSDAIAEFISGITRTMKNTYQPVVTIVKFLNWTEQDFTGFWDKVPYHFAAGESSKMEDWKAEHFARHLTDQYLHSKGLEARRKEDSYKALMRKAVIRSENAPTSHNQGEMSKLSTELLNDFKGPSEADLKAQEMAANANALDLKPEEMPKVKLFCDACGSRGIRHKKACPKLAPKPNEASNTETNG